MTNRTTPMSRSEAVVQHMMEQMARVTRMLSDWVQTEPRTLQDIEGQTMRVLHDLGTMLLTALVPLAAPARPAPDVPCPRGHTARYVRMRPATVTTVLGRVTVERAISHGAHCGA